MAFHFQHFQTFLTIWTMSSSCKTCSLPTFWGRCFTLVPHTSAYLNCFKMPLCMRLQKASTVL